MNSSTEERLPCGQLLRVSSVHCLNRDADVDLVFNSLATVFFPAAFCPSQRCTSHQIKDPTRTLSPCVRERGCVRIAGVFGRIGTRVGI